VEARGCCIADIDIKVELREAIMANIASFIKPLEDGYPDARLAAIETIDKLAEHGELQLNWLLI